MSIDELVNEWKHGDSLNSSVSSSPGLSILLENLDDGEEQCMSASEGAADTGLMPTRSTSSESVPSLEADDRSIISLGSPATPESLRSCKSSGNLRRDKIRSMAPAEDTTWDHPLVETPPVDEDEALELSVPDRSASPKPKSSFTSNLTLSLRALKKSITSSFTLSNATVPSQRQVPSSAFSDEMLWSHPFLFPRVGSEVRPTIQGTPTKAQRRYLNPMPLTFEEQEAPFQQALHAPYLAERVEDVPTIQMQTYNRGRRKAKRASSPDPNSEAGRALLGPTTGVRQREPRENSDFLRVVVLEMNMRREGKLESGRARIWLPPRQVTSVSADEASEAAAATAAENSRIPKRWVGVSAY
jgi:hypothetical protein